MRYQETSREAWQSVQPSLGAVDSRIEVGTMTYPLARDGVFWTVQGEGALQGEPMAFVRLAGCSVGCSQCDTDYRVHRRVTVPEVVAEVRAVVPAGRERAWVWITGGEPSDHNLIPLVDDLRGRYAFRVAIATSGKNTVPPADWISVSPHTATIAQTHGHELKVVPRLNGLSWADVEAFGRLSFAHRFIQPLWWRTPNGPEADGAMSEKEASDCLEFVRTHPGWRMGIQAHKYWNVP